VSSKPPIGYIDVRVFAHATEDPEKVLTAVRNILPEELSEKAIFQKTSLTGHHGNPITLFRTKLTDKQALPTVLQKIGAGLTALDKETLERNMKLHLEKGNLYLRFDKQSAFQSEVRF
jgi:RNA binding exosome subunit